MSPLYTFNGSILKVGNALRGCCCGEPVCCCLDFANVNFSFTIDCGSGNETYTGVIDEFGNSTDVETGLWGVSVTCTPSSCTPEDSCDVDSNDSTCVIFLISVGRFDSGICGGTAIYICPGNSSLWNATTCVDAPKANFTTDLFKCVSGTPVINGSITFTP